MYHGTSVPFPRHPHRGFETVTISRFGLVDHSDSLGATARFGNGDTQWMTAGRGIVHAEMFPLRAQHEPNPLDFFQVWINLPSQSKFAQPHFTMMWDKTIPTHRLHDHAGKEVVVRTVAGPLNQARPPSPPPDSWAARKDAHVSIWTMILRQVQRVVPSTGWGEPCSLCSWGSVDRDRRYNRRSVPELPCAQTFLSCSEQDQRHPRFFLEGKPIGEPVARHGPFAMHPKCGKLRIIAARALADGRRAMRRFIPRSRERLRSRGWPFHSP